MIQYIVKRDGRLEKWDVSRIHAAIAKAMVASGMTTDFASNVAKAVEGKVNNLGEPKVDLERVQDFVERALMDAKLYEAAINYIIYRRERAKERENDAVLKDTCQVIDSYIDEVDWRVAENSNIAHSFQGMMLHLSGTMQSRYTLEKFSQEIRDAHKHGFFHIHDLSFGLAGYCAGWSLKDLLLEGFNLKDRCSAGPAKHLDSAFGQMVNFLGTIQNEWAGAQAFNNVDTLLAPFVRLDGLTFKKVKQAMQKFVFNMNTTSRWGGQSPFTNLTFDLVCPKHMEKEPVILGGRAHDSWLYGDFQDEMNMINQAYVEVMLEGDYSGRIFSFPIPTYNVTKDFPWDSEIGQLILKLTAKYGVPYFQNFINSDLNPEDVRSMCCRLQMDLREIRKKTGGLFGAGDQTGSIGVVTLNLPRMAYLATSEEEFLGMVTKYAGLAKNSLELKRKMLTAKLEKGFYPWTRRYLKHGYRGHFSTIGVVGGHEACLNLIRKGINTPEGVTLMQKTLNHLRGLMEAFQEETGNLYNLEATPAEATSYRLARIDRKEFADIKQSGNGEPYYTNSTALPVNVTANPIEALRHQNGLQPLYSGGTVFHTFLGEAVADLNSLKNFIIKALTNTKLPYLSVTPTFSICEKHGYLKGEVMTCPDCGSETEVYTRVVGYYRPVARWNKGKQAEYKDRRLFSLELATV